MYIYKILYIHTIFCNLDKHIRTLKMALGTIANSQITQTLPSLSFLVDYYAPHEVREFQNYWVNISDLYLGTVAVHRVKRAKQPKIRLRGMFVTSV